MGRKSEDEAAAGSRGQAEGVKPDWASVSPDRSSEPRGAASETWIRTLAGEWSERWNRSSQSLGPTRSDQTFAR